MQCSCCYPNRCYIRRVLEGVWSECCSANISSEGSGGISVKFQHVGPVEETTVETQEPEEFISTPMELQLISDEDWDPPTEFAVVFSKIAKQLNKTADVEVLKDFLKCLCHPRSGQRFFNTKLYAHCVTPQDILEALFPQYINFMHTHLLRQILIKFGNEQSITLLKQYEDKFPCKKLLTKMHGVPGSGDSAKKPQLEIEASGKYASTAYLCHICMPLSSSGKRHFRVRGAK